MEQLRVKLVILFLALSLAASGCVPHQGGSYGSGPYYDDDYYRRQDADYYRQQQERYEYERQRRLALE